MNAGSRFQHGLPDWHEVSAAIRYVAGDKPGDHLVTRWARALAHLHRTRRIDPGRAELVTQINRRVTTHLASATGAADVGPAADALAGAYVDVEALLLAQEEVTEETLHAAWTQVGYLATQWATSSPR
ncbi:hypothetical protein IU427_13305 [Nocardia beijingensis]|uniref:hypothetical protein n=1 Tax=Nocardia beijingensis TaxID=95162 RepID=UPI001894B86C|nr:hypothetical protein [Nocardia beijingensis]MBF6466152.1 hypothetical protein [Nocardia beijingensis]